jgi:hypothetical protein
MSAFGTIVIGKRETLQRPGVVGPGEAPLDWPDQGSAERNWSLNSALLARVIAAGCAIRDASAGGGRLVDHHGFLARERRQMRAAGLGPGRDGYWRAAPRHTLLDVAPVLLARARTAAAAGAPTFALPEAAPVAVWIAARVTEPELRREAVRWLRRGTSYHGFVRLCARAALALDAAPFAPTFRAKVAAELAPMLSLWPHVLVLPTIARLSRTDLVRLRAFPVHPLGLVAEPTRADGSLLPPSEYFFHDLDHARFKVREDLLLRGFSVPDAYRDGSTIDPGTGRHRAILRFAAGGVGALSHRDAQAGARRLLDRVGALRGVVARAAALLLFEMVHEKSLPLAPASLARAARSDDHLLKLARKQASGFLAPGAEVMAALPAARSALVEIGS